MPKQKKIKELLKDLERRVFTDFEIEEPSKEVKIIGKTKLGDIESFIQLKQAIKYLRKENKRLKKEREMLLYCKQHYERMILSNNPVAEFKCAKKNGPKEKGNYYCIVLCGGEHIYEYAWFSGDNWSKVVIAFTETDPGEIFDALNKTK